MTATRVQTEFTYKSTAGSRDYYWEIVIDEQGIAQVRNVRSPTGLIRDPMTGVPQNVAYDIDESLRNSQALVLETSAYTGSVTFTGQSLQTANIPAGVLNNTEYRVTYSAPDYLLFRTLNKTITSFDVDAGVTYGSPTDPKVVDYVVLAKTAQASAFSGTVTFTDASVDGKEQITFASVFPTDTYRVILTPDNFVPVRVSERRTTDFTVELGITLQVGETVDVGYDVFV